MMQGGGTARAVLTGSGHNKGVELARSQIRCFRRGAEKIRKKLQVPVPGVGYWAKVYADHAQDRKPLPKATSELRGAHTTAG